MKFTCSLKKNYEFKTVYNRGRSLVDRRLVVYVLENGRQQNRLGLSVSKKVGKSVIRSRVTRLIRESYRLKESRIRNGLDIVVIARSNAAEASFDDISKSLCYLLKKHGAMISAE